MNGVGDIVQALIDPEKDLMGEIQERGHFATENNSMGSSGRNLEIFRGRSAKDVNFKSSAPMEEYEVYIHTMGNMYTVRVRASKERRFLRSPRSLESCFRKEYAQKPRPRYNITLFQ